MACSEHPNAPHGFDRNASITENRYVCECEMWQEDERDKLFRAHSIELERADYLAQINHEMKLLYGEYAMKNVAPNVAVTYTATWYEVQDEEGCRMRRFSTKEEADHFAKQDRWTVEKVSVTRELFTPEEAPF